ncbi:MAG: hypothetical protein DRP83_03250 [Planctomycetota bacterium]|nr:MAG: hypothetical protein DRP83_03250 [Planctomycetota bacterium]
MSGLSSLRIAPFFCAEREKTPAASNQPSAKTAGSIQPGAAVLIGWYPTHSKNIRGLLFLIFTRKPRNFSPAFEGLWTISR